MTETTMYLSKSTALILLLLAVALVAALARVADVKHDHEVTRGCMDRLVEPSPNDLDYNKQALLYASDVRECMRG